MAEIRWFWRRQLPDQLELWFASAAVHGCAPLESTGANLEAGEPAPGLLGGDGEWQDMESDPGGHVAIVNAPPFVGTIRLWTKTPGAFAARWPAAPGWAVHRRWLRKFDTSGGWAREVTVDSSNLLAAGMRSMRCQSTCELAQLVTTDGASWWTMGLVAGGDRDTAAHNLSLVAHTLAARRPPFWARGFLASYPKWARDQLERSSSLAS